MWDLAWMIIGTCLTKISLTNLCLAKKVGPNFIKQQNIENLYNNLRFDKLICRMVVNQLNLFGYCVVKLNNFK